MVEPIGPVVVLMVDVSTVEISPELTEPVGLVEEMLTEAFETVGITQHQIES